MRRTNLTPREVAGALGTRLDYIYKLIERGRLQAHKDSAGRWQVPKAAVELRKRFMEARNAACGR